MTNSIENRLKALESQTANEHRPITIIDSPIVNPDRTYTGEIYRTDLSGDKPKHSVIFDEDLKGKLCQ